ncbi:MAG: porphobilinogen deaminase [Actinomycetota bacterium]
MSQPRTIRIATRASAQARTQSESVARAIEAAHPDLSVELVFVDTTGDQRHDVPLHTIGGQGVFVKEVQWAVLDGRADIAAHSAKDLPSSAVDDASVALTIGAFCERRSSADALIGSRLTDLAEGATVATGSVRRRAQLVAVRPDLTFVELRGNIQTRLTKVPAGGAIVMAVAALEILGLTDLIDDELPVEPFVPAVGQGCVAVECLADDHATLQVLAAVDHAGSRHDVQVERAFLATLGTGCSLPVGAHVRDGVLSAFLADPEQGRHVLRRATLPTDVVAASQAARELALTMQSELG